MIVYEAKLRGTEAQYRLLDEAIRTGQFIRNKALRYWMDNQGVKRSDLLKLCTSLRNKFSWCRKLSAQACQSSVDRAWAAISRFYQNCRSPVSRKKGYPKFKKNSRSVEYKVDGWKLSDDKRRIKFRDGLMAGEFQLIGTRDLNFYQKEQIKRVRVVKRTTGYYCQFCIDYDRVEQHLWTGRVVGIDRGIDCFYTDSDGNTVKNPQFSQKSEKAFKNAQSRLFRRVIGSKNRAKAKNRVGRIHLKIVRRRRDWACKTAQALVKSADLIVYQDLQIYSLSNKDKAKSINYKIWTDFLRWVEYYAKIHGIVTIAIPPDFKAQVSDKFEAGLEKAQDISEYEHLKNDAKSSQDQNTAKMILAKGLSIIGEKREEIVKLLNTMGRMEINA